MSQQLLPVMGVSCGSSFWALLVAWVESLMRWQFLSVWFGNDMPTLGAGVNMDVDVHALFLCLCCPHMCWRIVRFMPNGQIVSVLGKLCIGLEEDAGIVMLSKCDESDGGAKWEVQGCERGQCDAGK